MHGRGLSSRRHLRLDTRRGPGHDDNRGAIHQALDLEARVIPRLCPRKVIPRGCCGTPESPTDTGQVLRDPTRHGQQQRGDNTGGGR